MSDKEEIFSKAIKKFGEQHQLVVAIEELAELQKEITKLIRYLATGGDMENWVGMTMMEEIADCEVMIWQLKKILGNYKGNIVVETLVDEFVNNKLLRLDKIL